jgi:hypothetical protein
VYYGSKMGLKKLASPHNFYSARGGAKRRLKILV